MIQNERRPTTCEAVLCVVVVVVVARTLFFFFFSFLPAPHPARYPLSSLFVIFFFCLFGIGLGLPRLRLAPGRGGRGRLLVTRDLFVEALGYEERGDRGEHGARQQGKGRGSTGHLPLRRDHECGKLRLRGVEGHRERVARARHGQERPRLYLSRAMSPTVLVSLVSGQVRGGGDDSSRTHWTGRGGRVFAARASTALRGGPRGVCQHQLATWSCVQEQQGRAPVRSGVVVAALSRAGLAHSHHGCWATTLCRFRE